MKMEWEVVDQAVFAGERLLTGCELTEMSD